MPGVLRDRQPAVAAGRPPSPLGPDRITVGAERGNPGVCHPRAHPRAALQLARARHRRASRHGPGHGARPLRRAARGAAIPRRVPGPVNPAVRAYALDPRIAEALGTGAVEPDLRSLRASSAGRPGSDPQVRDDIAHLKGRSLPIRLYQGTRDDCVVVFFHGGGFVKGDLDSHDVQARTLCGVTRRPVVSVGYRLAPEHRFPSAHDDAVEAVRWVHENARTLVGRPAQVAVAGSSAGANRASAPRRPSLPRRRPRSRNCSSVPSPRATRRCPRAPSSPRATG